MRLNTLIPNTECRVSDARIAWKALNGVFAIYKPAAVTFPNIRETIIYHLCKDLNSMHVRPPIQHVCIKGNTTEKMKVTTRPSFADDLLVVGPRYQLNDIKLASANSLSRDTSGLMVCGINGGTDWIKKLRESKSPVIYKVKGILGHATDNYFKTGKIVEKSTYKYIKRDAIDKICASLQAAHQKKMFELCGIDIQSQAAFEMASQGLIRPVDKDIPVIYNIKCVDFTSPEFTLEIVCINEYEMYLKGLIHEIGMQLHSVATCTQIQCIQYALFNVDFALLKKYWDLQNILDSIQQCHNILDKNRDLLRQDKPILTTRNNN